MNSTEAKEKVDSTTAHRPHRLYSTSDPSGLDKLKALVSHQTGSEIYRQCSGIEKNIPIYDLSAHLAEDAHMVSVLQDEWHSILHSGPGVFVLQNFFPTATLNIIDSSNAVFDRIIDSEASSTRGDHFAASDANSRIWNSLQKHALMDPISFVKYYSNPWLKHVSESWLGPDYTVTAQVNIVRPGGKPQMPHRDYHLGFQTAQQCARWPKTVHATSQFLTLQGAVAHSDMPLESGPTRFLPFSQMLENGFMVWRTEELKALFTDRWVSLPLKKGDAVFFNPALIHAAGENLTKSGENGIDRSANLLQISSAFGKTMEKIDHERIVIACWDTVLSLKGELSNLELDCALDAMTDGYPFPTNLDQRPPAPGGMAPDSQADLVGRYLKQRKSRGEIIEALRELREQSSV